MFHVRLRMHVESHDLAFCRDIELPFAPFPSVDVSPGSEDSIFPGFALDLNRGSIEEDQYDVYHVTWNHLHAFFEVAVLEWQHLKHRAAEDVITTLTKLGWELQP